MTRWRWAALPLLCATLVCAQDVVSGTVRDSQHHAAAGVTVTLERTGSKETVTAKTNAQGVYRVTIPAGTYLVHAENQNGRGAAGPITVPLKTSVSVDLTLQPTATAQLPFFDEPQFTVAGVKDNTYRGGHGSDGMLRSTEALTKETAALSKASGGAEDPLRTQAEINEREGHALEALEEYQRAAKLNPSEPNYYDWGTELLTHRAPVAAAEIFEKGVWLFPQSVRMMLGLATASYGAGAYEKAGVWFYKAADADPGNPTPYLFLGKVQAREINETPEYAERMDRFAKLHPNDARAQYYDAVSVWNRSSGPDDVAAASQSRASLEKAVAIDPQFGPAYLEMGIIDATQRKYAEAIATYRRAIEVSPELSEAHYRLSAVYRLTGEREKADEEMAIYNRQSKQSAEALERERSAIQQFVLDLKSPVKPK